MMEFTYDGIVRPGFGFYNPNHAATLICATLPFCWYAIRYWRHVSGRIAFGLASLLLTLALAMTMSRSGILIFFAELFCFMLSDKKHSWKLILASSLGALLLFVAMGIGRRLAWDLSTSNRLEIWLAGLKLASANSWLGVGHGNSGTLATAFLLRDGITCRTLVNSHLALLAEYGIFTAVLWFSVIVYALISGWHRRVTWISFAGMCASAFFSSVFDWNILFDFREYGGLPLTNFMLSWILFLLFLVCGVWLCVGKVSKKMLATVAGVSICLTLGLLLFPAGNAPRVRRGEVTPPSGYNNGRTLVILSPALPLKDCVEFLKRYGYSDYRIPLSSPAIALRKSSEVVFFSDASEYFLLYNNADLIFVSPPEYFVLPPQTQKLFLKRFQNDFALEEQAEKLHVPVIRY